MTFLFAVLQLGLHRAPHWRWSGASPVTEGWTACARTTIPSGLPVLGLGLRAAACSLFVNSVQVTVGRSPQAQLCVWGSERQGRVGGGRRGRAGASVSSARLLSSGHRRPHTGSPCVGWEQVLLRPSLEQGVGLADRPAAERPFSEVGGLCLEPCGAHGPLTFGMTRGDRVSGRGSFTLPGREQGSGEGPAFLPCPGPPAASPADAAHSDGGVDAAAQAPGPAAHLRVPDGLAQ